MEKDSDENMKKDHNEKERKEKLEIILEENNCNLSDEINNPSGSLADNLKGKANNIYLSDYKEASFSKNGINAKVYAENGSDMNLNIQVFEKDGQKYLFVDEGVIVNDKSVNILEKRPVKTKKNKEEQKSTFDLSSFVDTPRKPVPFINLLT